MTPRDATAISIDTLSLARQAGLDRAATDFPADVAAAAESAAEMRRAAAGGGAPTDEPWPPMRARTAS